MRPAVYVLFSTIEMGSKIDALFSTNVEHVSSIVTSDLSPLTRWIPQFEYGKSPKARRKCMRMSEIRTYPEGESLDLLELRVDRPWYLLAKSYRASPSWSLMQLEDCKMENPQINAMKFKQKNRVFCVLPRRFRVGTIVGVRPGWHWRKCVGSWWVGPDWSNRKIGFPPGKTGSHSGDSPALGNIEGPDLRGIHHHSRINRREEQSLAMDWFQFSFGRGQDDRFGRLKISWRSRSRSTLPSMWWNHVPVQNERFYYCTISSGAVAKKSGIYLIKLHKSRFPNDVSPFKDVELEAVHGIVSSFISVRSLPLPSPLNLPPFCLQCLRTMKKDEKRLQNQSVFIQRSSSFVKMFRCSPIPSVFFPISSVSINLKPVFIVKGFREKSQNGLENNICDGWLLDTMTSTRFVRSPS